MIKVDLITGFLGSGKTTFLLKYGRHLINKGLKIGILEYDYGAINVDMLLLGKLRGPNCELEMVAAGCDADCLRRRFQTKLISMAMSGYDRVLIEPSGVFDMDQFFDPLRDEPLEKFYEIGSVITVVNANLMDNLNEEEDYYIASQALGAGCVVLSRTQLSGPKNIEKTKKHIDTAAEKIRAAKRVNNYLEKNWDDLTDADFDMLTNCGYNICDYIKVTGADTDRFDSVNILDIDINLEGFKEKTRRLFSSNEYGNIIRVKGFVNDKGVSYQVNATQYETLVDPIAIGSNMVIVIGTDLNKDKINEFFA